MTPDERFPPCESETDLERQWHTNLTKDNSFICMISYNSRGFSLFCSPAQCSFFTTTVISRYSGFPFIHYLAIILLCSNLRFAYLDTHLLCGTSTFAYSFAYCDSIHPLCTAYDSQLLPAASSHMYMRRLFTPTGRVGNRSMHVAHTSFSEEMAQWLLDGQDRTSGCPLRRPGT